MKEWLTQKALDLVVYLNRDSNYISHCKREVPSWFKETGPHRWIADSTVELLAVLSHQGHSGSSIGFVLQFFTTIASFKPWGPLTGKEEEWSDPFDFEGTRQNRRCSHIFLRPDGTAYDANGKVFHDGDHVYYTDRNSRVDITFPYTVPDMLDLIKANHKHE